MWTTKDRRLAALVIFGPPSVALVVGLASGGLFVAQGLQLQAGSIVSGALVLAGGLFRSCRTVAPMILRGVGIVVAAPTAASEVVGPDVEDPSTDPG